MTDRPDTPAPRRLTVEDEERIRACAASVPAIGYLTTALASAHGPHVPADIARLAREDVPLLLAEIEALRAALTGLAEINRAWIDCMFGVDREIWEEAIEEADAALKASQNDATRSAGAANDVQAASDLHLAELEATRKVTNRFWIERLIECWGEYYRADVEKDPLYYLYGLIPDEYCRIEMQEALLKQRQTAAGEQTK